jgi:hypothetical protein
VLTAEALNEQAFSLPMNPTMSLSDALIEAVRA